MSKISTIHICSNCDAQFPKWSGRCLECGKWGTLKTQTVDARSSGKKSAAITPAETIDFSNYKAKDYKRLKTGISEVDRVLGGGIMPGALILLAGEPGIGKSTIVAQIAGKLQKYFPALYASGEESAGQVKARLDRLQSITTNLQFINETNVEKIISTINHAKPTLVIIDSIQATYTAQVETEAGSLSQIRASAAQFLEIAKQKNIAIILVGHVTKDGLVAGPKSLEHIVDTVIYLEIESAHGYRVLRTTKNRFGSVNELGIFTMTERGFEEIKNPAGVFLQTSEDKLPGSVISCIMEGTRPFLIEVQALVTKTVFGYPQRKSSGLDLSRLQILTAVLTKRAGINLVNQDVIVNVVGGLKVSDTAIDLAICLAIASSLLNQVIDRKTVVLGEVGLGGEVRNVGKLKEMLAEAEKLGFTKAIAPDYDVKVKKIKLQKVKNLNEVIKTITK